MRDTTNLFTAEETLAGYLETDTGTILMTDGLWENTLPLTAQNRLTLDLGIERCRIPVYAMLRNEKRFLILGIDDALIPVNDVETVDTEDQVNPPKNEDEEELPSGPGQEDDNG